ncbi:MAG: S8 family serine peptidase [Acidimicrobiales bacterium]
MRRTVRSLVGFCGGGLGLIVALSPAEAGETTPNDPVYEEGLQWGLERIGAPAAWAVGTGEGTTIAVVDSGVDLTHEDLVPQLEGNVSCVGSGGNAAACSGSGQDDNGHGTHVAGIALAATDNSRGVAGVAPGARLLAVRVLENTCEGSDPCTATGSADDVAAGIRWAADQGADVINLSLGGGTLEGVSGCAFCDAVEYAWSKGAIAVVAAGNESGLPASFSDEHAVIVTATTRADTRASYGQASTAGLTAARWPVSAPGGEAEEDPDDCSTDGTPKGILSTYWAEGEQNRYACSAGTSMAAPHVSAALAVLRGTGLSPQASIERLVQTSQDLGAPGRDREFGIGRIDLGRAVGTAPGGTATTSTVAGTTTSASVVVAGDEGSSTTTAPAVTTTTAPPVSLPPVAAPAPFDTAAPPVDGDPLPGGLVALAMLAVLAAGGASVATARRLAHANRAAAGTTAGTAYGGAPPPGP